MNRITRTLFTSWLVLSGIFGSPTPCVAGTPVILNSSIEISRAAVRLSDLFMGVPSAIDRDIAQAPPACSPALYDETVLRKLAETYRLDWQKQGSKDRVIVSSACSRLSADRIREAIVAKLKEDSSARRAHFDVLFDKRGLEIALPVNDDPDFTLDGFSFDPTNKRFRTDLTAQTPHGPHVVQITGRILVKKRVPVLARRLESGSLIQTNDLDWIELPEERITADIITESSQLVGRELRYNTTEGDFLRSRDVMPPRLVQRGSLVTMKIETPFILITAQGKAQQDGAHGETIRILNTQSNRVVEGTVVAPGVVEIRTARKIASVR